MAYEKKLKINNGDTVSSCGVMSDKKAMFHDFLGVKSATDKYAAVLPPKNASSSASEKQVEGHLEGIPFYGISCRDMSNRSKRSNSDSAFTDSLESLHLLKAMRPTAASLLLQSSRLDANLCKWEPSIASGSALQHPQHIRQFTPFKHQSPANKFRDASTAGTSIISQPASDEGSRTGIKGPGILSSINAGSSISLKNSSGMLSIGSKVKSSEPESSTSLSRQGLMSTNRQMTIFYGGQAHVFDDVHPNKADVIMALAGSNGGSWSTTYSPRPTRRPGGESYTTGVNEAAGMGADVALHLETDGRLPGTGTGNATQSRIS